jgi:hypothetical protein
MRNRSTGGATVTIHYQNAKGEEVFISGVTHLQNLDNEIWVATVGEGKELYLRTSRIEGIYHKNTRTRKTGYTKQDLERDDEAEFWMNEAKGC